jgi:hypothetical protein
MPAASYKPTVGPKWKVPHRKSVNTGAFFVTNPLGSPKLKLDERVGLKSLREANFRIARDPVANSKNQLSPALLRKPGLHNRRDFTIGERIRSRAAKAGIP